MRGVFDLSSTKMITDVPANNSGLIIVLKSFFLTTVKPVAGKQSVDTGPSSPGLVPTPRRRTVLS